MPGVVSKQEYSRKEACRLVEVSERQLRGWEKQGLIEAREGYGFAELAALRALARLRASRVRPAKIRQAVEALRRRLGEEGSPLAGVRLYAEGRKIRVQVGGQEMEPLSGQLLLAFREGELERLVAFPAQEQRQAKPGPQETALAAEWFEKGLDLERRGYSLKEVAEAYERALEADPGFAGALVNLGTLHFTTRNWTKAEDYYKRAIEADPGYALAHFNLGNLYDEAGERDKALAEYQAALRAKADYGDAHYNIALLYQSGGHVMEAMRHWKAYLRLDGTSQWAAVARRELNKLRQATVIKSPGQEGQAGR